MSKNMKEALKLALDALEMTLDTPTDVYDTKYQKAIDVAKEALRSSPTNGEAQQEQRSANEHLEPVAWPVEEQPDGSIIPVDPSEMTAEQLQRYTAPPQGIYYTPPQRKPLTDAQREEIAKGWRGRNWTVGDIIDAIEAAYGIKEKNT